jgi:hypothetical protein
MKLRTTLSVIVRACSSLAVGCGLAGCGGSSSGVRSDPSIVGIWGVTTTVAQGASSQIDETYVVYGSDMTVRDFFRTTTKYGTSTTSTSLCGSGTYVFANGVLPSPPAPAAYPKWGMRARTRPRMHGSMRSARPEQPP